MSSIPLAPASRPPGTAPVGTRVTHPEDLALVRRILAEDESAWREFVDRYTGLILAMTRRYLRRRDRDDEWSVFANVLDSLRRSRFRTYEARASLATWLALVTRSEVMDHLRRRIGRDLRARVLERLTTAERTFFQLYCVEGHSHGTVVARLSADGTPWTDERFVNTLHDVERKVGKRHLRRLAYDLQALSIGAPSGRLLEYHDHVKDELAAASRSADPAAGWERREATRRLEALGETIATLRKKDRLLLELRFEKGWTARQIAAELGVKSDRGVYRSLQRLLLRLRRRLTERGWVVP